MDALNQSTTFVAVSALLWTCAVQAGDLPRSRPLCLNAEVNHLVSVCVHIQRPVSPKNKCKAHC